MTIVKAASEPNAYSQIFRPITTARLQVVAEKSGMYSWCDNKFINFLYFSTITNYISVVEEGNNLWVLGKRWWSSTRSPPPVLAQSLVAWVKILALVGACGGRVPGFHKLAFIFRRSVSHDGSSDLYSTHLVLIDVSIPNSSSRSVSLEFLCINSKKAVAWLIFIRHKPTREQLVVCVDYCILLSRSKARFHHTKVIP